MNLRRKTRQLPPVPRMRTALDVLSERFHHIAQALLNGDAVTDDDERFVHTYLRHNHPFTDVVVGVSHHDRRM